MNTLPQWQNLTFALCKLVFVFGQRLFVGEEEPLLNDIQYGVDYGIFFGSLTIPTEWCAKVCVTISNFNVLR